MKEKIVNYFFDEDEKELVSKYSFLVKLALVVFVLTILIRIF